MATTKTKTFPTKKAALQNARQLEKRGEISKSDLKRIQKSVPR